MTTHQEFVEACSLMQSCLANLRCGVHIEKGTELYIDTLRRHSREYLEECTKR